MCGIFGFVGGMDSAAGVDVDAVLRSLGHRGPDDRGTFTDTFPVADKPSHTCILVQTRLSILDLSPAGHQPMSTPDGRWRLIFNGEIYNHRELRADLQREGARFEGTSDTEVVLHALVRWGAQALRRFTGMFTVALWDRQNASMLMARDRLGEKPLYVAWDQRSGNLAFASEVRTLLTSGVVERVASRQGLLSYLEAGSVAEPWTAIRNVWAFPPATVALFQSGVVTSERFWESPFHQAPSRTLQDGAPLVRARLVDAVRDQLVADVPVGLFLSAGMDSTAIAALATLAQGGGVRSFTVSLDDGGLDEGAVAARVAHQIGCEHHDVHVSNSEAVAQVPDAVAALDQPSIDGVNTYIVSKAVRDAGTVVALSGIGGDEIFAGYRTFRTYGRWARLNGLVRAMGAGPFTRWAARSDLPLSVRVRKALGLAGADQVSGDFHRGFRSLFSSGQVQRLSEGTLEETRDGEPYPPWFDSGNDGPGAESGTVSAVSQMELDGYLRNTLLRDSDAMSMAHGLEVRAPFLDHQLVALAASVHGRDKIAGTINKPLLAAAVTELPDLVTRRRKTGFALPFDAWLRGPLRRWAAGSLEVAAGSFSTAESRRIWGLFQGGSQTVSWSRAWALVVLASWLQRNQVTLA
jgi:asparagine synthase (glutamine-hydrolysing)